MSSGFWAGAGAADFAHEVGSASTSRAGRRVIRRAGGAALRGGRDYTTYDSAEVIRAVQAEVFPYERNWTRRGDLLEDSLQRLDRLWSHVRHSAPARSAQEAVRAREAAAMLATSRWMYRSALQRTETRGMHRRQEHAAIDPAQQHRLISGGLDEVWVRSQAVTRHTTEHALAGVAA